MEENKKMNPEVKVKLLEALKSGEYKKGVLGLKNRTKEGVFHCCLGVLCELYIKEKGEGQWKEKREEGGGIYSGQYEVFELHGKLTSSFPLQEVWEWAGLSTLQGTLVVKPGEYGSDTGRTSLAGINDSTDPGWTCSDFSLVIDAIEKYL